MLIYNFPGAFVEGRAMELGIIDIEADVEYVLFHRRLRFSRGKVVLPTF